MKAKNKLVVRSIEIKKREKIHVLIFKISYMKEKKDIAPMNFTEYRRKLGVSENSKVYWNERNCYVSKSRWDEQYLKSL